MRSAKVTLVISIIALLSVAAACFVFCISRYTQVLMWLQAMYAHSNTTQKLTTLFSEKKFEQLSIVACIAGTAALCICIFLFLLRKKILVVLSRAIPVFQKDCTAVLGLTYLPQKEKWSVVACLVFLGARSIYYIATWHITHDEGWSYINHIQYGPLSAAFAPGNNHMLLTFCASMLHTVFSAAISMRIIALLGGLLSILFFAKWLFSICKNYYFILGIVLFSCSIPLLYYSIIGRSYSLCILFTTVLIHSVLAMQRGKKYLFYFVLATILGIWSSPAFLYSLCSVLCAYFLSIIFFQKKQNNTSSISSLLGSIIAALIIGALPYSLSIITSLTTSIEQNANSSFITFQPSRLLDAAHTLVFYFTGLRHGGVAGIAALALLGIVAWRRPQPLLFYCIVAFICAFGFYYFLHRHDPYARLFSYLVVFTTPLVIKTIEYFFTAKWNSIATTLSCMAIIAASVYIFRKHTLFHWSEQLDHNAYQVAQVLFERKATQLNAYYIYPLPAIETFFAERHIAITINKATKQNFAPLPIAPALYHTDSATQIGTRFGEILLLP